MHPEYADKAPRGSGWYILLEDGTMLEGGPFASEEATWAEIALREPREVPERARDAGSDRTFRSRRAKLAVDDC